MDETRWRELAAALSPRAPAPLRKRFSRTESGGGGGRRNVYDHRFSACYRHYKYFFHLEEGMSLEAMREGAARLVGQHDFRNFCKMKAAVVHNFVREVLSSTISPVPQCVARCPAPERPLTQGSSRDVSGESSTLAQLQRAQGH